MMCLASSNVLSQSSRLSKYAFYSLFDTCSKSIQWQCVRQINLWEGDRQRGYKHKMEKSPSFIEKAKLGAKQFPSELSKFGHEVKDHFTPAVWNLQHGDYKYQWRLNSQQDLDMWVLSTDADMDAGQSSANITLSQHKTMLFHGFLNTTVPDDGVTKYAGYVNVRSPYDMKSFGRIVPYDWGDFTHLVIRCRGDGRPYQLNIHMDNYFDVAWHDIYTFWLYTRGGPYWQVAKIPFSKFLLSNKGRIQDKQEPIHLDRVRNFAITLSDDATGSFCLELDYIGLIYDAYDQHKFFYEMYDSDPLMS